MRRYYEVRKEKRKTTYISTPTHIAMYPGEKDLIVPEVWARRTYNIVEWQNMEVGGHFPASEVPDMHFGDIDKVEKPNKQIKATALNVAALYKS